MSKEHVPPEAATVEDPARGAHLASQARSRVQLDTFTLLAASGINGVLGVVYWGASTRLYGVEEVGRATTIINSALLLASLSNLALGPLYERFLSVAGHKQRRLVFIGQAFTATLALVLSAGFLLLAPSELRGAHGWSDLLFLVAVPTLATFSLQDAILVGLGAGRWAAAQNTIHAVAKLALAVGLAVMGTASALVSSWILPALLAVAAVEILLVSRRGPLARDRDSPSRLPDRRVIGTFAGWAMVWMVAQTMPGLLIPLMVVSIRGVVDAAYFNIAWTIVAASLLLMTLVTGPYVAEASRAEQPGWHLTRNLARNLLLVNVARAILVGGAGPVVLFVYGREYFSAGMPLLLVMACCQLISTPGYLYASIARVQGRIMFPTVVQLLGAGALLIMVPYLISWFGIIGVGFAYGVHDIAVIIVIAPRLIRALRHQRTEAKQETVGASSPAQEA